MMKQLGQGIAKWISGACMMFAGSIIIYMIIAGAYGKFQIESGIVVSLLLMSAVGTGIQILAFTELVIKKMRYSLRIIVFTVPFFAMLAGCAGVFKWFPTEQYTSWVIFIAIFLFILIVMLIMFEIYFRAAGKKYDGLLGQYKNKSKL